MENPFTTYYKNVFSADGDDGGGVELRRHGRGGGRVDDAEDADEADGEGGAEGHVDHGERDGEGPVVHLGVEDVLVVDDDGEGEEDPDGHVAVGEEHLAEHRLQQAAGAPAAGHGSSCGGSGSGGRAVERRGRRGGGVDLRRESRI